MALLRQIRRKIALLFEPELIQKRETILAKNLENNVLEIQGRGMSLRDIPKHIQDMFDTNIGQVTLPAITDKIIPQVKE